jgi:SAM-dependent methyltransferase
VIISLAASIVMLLLVTTGSATDVDVPDRVQARARLEKARSAGDLEAMAKHAEEIAFAELVDYLEASYDLLIIQCQQGDEEEAFKTVEAMLDAGFWDYRRLLGDEQLTLINSTERLRGLVRAAWAKGYISMLERESRDEMQHPEKVMKALAIQPGDAVADVGAGSGYFTVRVAAAVGSEGRVIATDIRQEMLDYISARLEDGDIRNVELLKVEPDDPGLPDGAVDLVLMVDVMHYVKKRTEYARRLKAALAPGGRIAIVDFRYDPEAQREFAPAPEQQVPRETLDREMAEAGLEVAEDHDFLPEQYLVIYRAAE